MSRLRVIALRWIVPPDWVLNTIVNRIPLLAPRMWAYRSLGVRFEDHRTGAIMLGTDVHHPRRLQIGRRSIVGGRCMLDARGGIRIGRDVNISGRARFMTAKHDIDDPEFGAVFEPAIVEDRVWIALGATVLGGVTIGEGAVVAAGVVVRRNVPANTLWASQGPRQYMKLTV